MRKFYYLFHAFAYYISWFYCLTLAAWGYAWWSTGLVMSCVVLQIFWQYKIQRQVQGLICWLGLVIFFSTLAESFLVYTGIIIYSANPFAPYATPPWMVAIWMSFAVILHATLRNLFDHLYLLGLLSFFGFAISYAVGVKMGAALMPYGYKTCFLVGAFWLIFLPLLAYGYKKMMGK